MAADQVSVKVAGLQMTLIQLKNSTTTVRAASIPAVKAAGEALKKQVVKYTGLQDVTLEVMAYSDESSDLAMRVYDVFYRGMQARRLIDPQGVITAKGSMREIERPWDGYNERTRSWYARGLWTATLAG